MIWCSFVLRERFWTTDLAQFCFCASRNFLGKHLTSYMDWKGHCNSNNWSNQYKKLAKVFINLHKKCEKKQNHSSYPTLSDHLNEINQATDDGQHHCNTQKAIYAYNRKSHKLHVIIYIKAHRKRHFKKLLYKQHPSCTSMNKCARYNLWTLQIDYLNFTHQPHNNSGWVLMIRSGKKALQFLTDLNRR